MKRNFASIKVEEETYNILRNLKEKQGIPMTEAIRVAVKKIYGTQTKEEE